MRQIVKVFIGLLLVAMLVGCGPRRPKMGVVSGTITYKGRPINGAALLLYPTNDPAGTSIVIPVDQEGAFRIADVPLGEYKIAVEGSAGAQQADLKNIPPDKLAEVKEKLGPMNTPKTIDFPDKYKNPKTTDLKCTVTEKDQTLNLEMKD
jgi:hypothetical protein